MAKMTVPPGCSKHTCASHGGGLRIDNFDLEFGGKSCRHENERKNYSAKHAHTILLYTRKGLTWTVCAGLLALRVRMACWDIRLLAAGLPGTHPSDQRRFPRLQLRGSAGFAPASLSSPSGEDARTEGQCERTKKLWGAIYRDGVVKVKSAANLTWPETLSCRPSRRWLRRIRGRGPEQPGAPPCSDRGLRRWCPAESE